MAAKCQKVLGSRFAKFWKGTKVPFGQNPTGIDCSE